MEELEMKINEFKENNETKKEVMDQKMEALKLENINSMWYFIVATLNVKSNILLPLYLGNSKIDEVYFEEIVEILGIKNKLKNLPNTLSGGQQQRVAIARAMITKPDIVLADEPTGNLDSESSEEVLRLLRESGERYNQTIIMITHSKEIAETASRIIRMRDGKIV